jgi:hypothetical protein
LEFWQGMHWLCKSLWVIFSSSCIKSSNSWTQNITLVKPLKFEQYFVIYSVQIFYSFS